jgi:hypothetical protein
MKSDGCNQTEIADTAVIHIHQIAVYISAAGFIHTEVEEVGTSAVRTCFNHMKYSISTDLQLFSSLINK